MRVGKMILAMVVMSVLFGCGHFRYVAVTEAQPTTDVRTENRYRLFEFAVRSGDGYKRLSEAEFNSLWTDFKVRMPMVFSDTGLPMAIYLDRTEAAETRYAWTIFFPYLLSCGVLPLWSEREWRSHYSIRFRKPKKVPGGLRNQYAVRMSTMYNMSCWGPISLFLPLGDPPAGVDEHVFSRHQGHILGSSDTAANNGVVHSALAYGAACALRRLEQDGSLPDDWTVDPVPEASSGEVVSDPSPPAPASSAVPAAPPAPTDRQPDVVELDEIPL